MRVTRFRIILALAAFALAGAVLAASGGAAAGASHRSVLKLRKTDLGTVLVDSRGFTLYLFEADKGKQSVCYGKCAQFWPPLLTTGKPVAGAGLKASLLGVTMRKGGAHQVTYAGHPLYFFAEDTKAGQTNGQGVTGFGAAWYVLAASGHKIDNDASDKTGTPPPTTTPDAGYGGY